jgi:antitoxin VapB
MAPAVQVTVKDKLPGAALRPAFPVYAMGGTMIDLSQETETLARRLADARHVTVDTVIRDALAAAAQGSPLIDPRRTRDASPEATERRRAALRDMRETIAALPVLDNRPVQDIVDDINAL